MPGEGQVIRGLQLARDRVCGGQTLRRHWVSRVDLRTQAGEVCTWREIGERLRPVLGRLGVSKAVLYGSIARGEPSPHSDVDLILVQETEKRFLERYAGILAPLAQALPERDVEVLIYTPAELDYMACRPFIARALREGKVIYESE